MPRTLTRFALGILVLALAACGSATTPTPPPASASPAPASVEPTASSAAPTSSASAPAMTGAEIVLGHYECQQFVTGSGWSYFGYVDILPGNNYDSNGGKGTYAYVPATSAVTFTGALYDNEFAGEYPKGSDNKSLRLYFYTDPDLLEIICSPGAS